MKYYTVEETAKKLKVSTNHIYELVKRGELIKKEGMGRAIRIPSSELDKVSTERNYFTYDSEKIEVINTHLGKVRKIKFKDEYVLTDIAKAIGFDNSYSIIKRIDKELYFKIKVEKARELGLYSNQCGLIIISYEGIVAYRKKSKSTLDLDRFLEELKDFTSKDVKNEFIKKDAPVESDNKIQIFKSPEFGEIRTLPINNEPWFVGKDVAEILGYSNSSKAVIMHVDSEDKISEMITHSQNGNVLKTQTTLINESGLYSLILSSKLPSAKQFKRWVTSEVLPTIRKTGGYVDNSSKFVDNYFSNFNSDTRRLLLGELNKKNKELLLKKHKIDKQITDNNLIISKIEETLKGSD